MGAFVNSTSVSGLTAFSSSRREVGHLAPATTFTSRREASKFVKCRRLSDGAASNFFLRPTVELGQEPVTPIHFRVRALAFLLRHARIVARRPQHAWLDPSSTPTPLLPRDRDLIRNVVVRSGR